MLSDDINASDYLPVVAKLNVEKSLRIEEKRKLIDVKPKWDKCNRQRYKASIDRNLGPFPDGIKTEFEFVCALGHMT